MRITARSFAALSSRSRTTAAPLAACALIVFTTLTLVPSLHPAPAAEQTPFNSIANLATALSENDASGALGYFDSHMKDYSDIEQRIEALTAQDDISCAIDIVTDTESGGVHKLDLDWFMQLTNQTDPSQLERRRRRIEVEVRRFRNVWKITGISIISIFDPIRIQ